MLKKNVTLTLLISIGFMAGFTLGLGVDFWTKVETVSIIFYSGVLVAILAGVFGFGFEFLLGFHAYRKMMAKRFDNASRLSGTNMNPPSLPKPELIDIPVETLENVYILFNQDEN